MTSPYTLPFSSAAEEFGTLPATSQAAIVMAVLSAFIIQIGALAAGEGLALLVLERRLASTFVKPNGVESYS